MNENITHSSTNLYGIVVSRNQTTRNNNDNHNGNYPIINRIDKHHDVTSDEWEGERGSRRKDRG